MSKYRFVESEPPEGTLTKGVVYWVDDEGEIEQAFREIGASRPKPIGYIVVDEDDDEEAKESQDDQRCRCGHRRNAHDWRGCRYADSEGLCMCSDDRGLGK